MLSLHQTFDDGYRVLRGSTIGESWNKLNFMVQSPGTGDARVSRVSAVRAGFGIHIPGKYLGTCVLGLFLFVVA
jgi:hypothetical protein